MNVARGLFRAWLLATIVWSIIGGWFAYLIVQKSYIQVSYQPAAVMKADAKTWDDIESPSEKKLSVQFFPVEYKYQIEWSTDARMKIHELPDGSKLYMATMYKQWDQAYIVQQFWSQRWQRWGMAAAIILASIIIPSAILFIFGYGLLWVARGFSK